MFLFAETQTIIFHLKRSIKLIGVDPGTTILGFAIITIDNKVINLLEMGVLHLRKYDSHYIRLQQIFTRLQQLMETHKPDEMAIEAPFYGKNVQSMLKLGRAQGVAIAAGMTNGVNVIEYSPKKIKQSITGNGNATKEQVAAMLENILAQKLDQYTSDATDALATAVCHYYQSQNALTNQNKYSDWKSYAKNHPKKIR